MKNFRILKLSLSGGGLDNAEVTFGAGLNVVSGASNSGKTFIFDAINFCFGGRSPLKPIPEAAGYSLVELEIETQDGRKVWLERPFVGGDLTMRDSESPGAEVVLADRFYETKSNNVSSVLLDLCNLTDRKVRKNAENELQNLSFRNIVHLIMVSELDIVKTDSPIFSGESTARTADTSIFKLLLTGEDDASLVATKKRNIVRAELNAQLEMLVELIDQYSKRLPSGALSSNETKDQYDKLKVAISNSENRISELRRILGKDVDGRVAIRREIAGAEERLEEIDSLLARFELLRQHYNSDLERLGAIAEAGDMFAPLPRGVCPLCGSTIGDESHENHIPSDRQVDSTRQAAEQEKNKINVLLSSLADTVTELELEAGSLEEVLTERRLSLTSIASNIDVSLQPSLEAEELNGRLLWEKFSSVRSVQSSYEHISGLQKKRDDVMEQLNAAGPPKKVRASIPAANLQMFTEHFKTLLKAWHYPENERVHFDTKLNDFTLGARRRGDEGKGSRALTHSAFTIGLMLTCRSLDLMHPGMVVLDSPLVTFRDSEGNDELLTDARTKIVVRDAFYRDLASCPKDCQIIILENEDPPDDLVESISYHHFTGSPSLGRRGFFPPRRQA